MTLYEAVDLTEGEPVQYVGVHAVRWQHEWGMPKLGFREVKDVEATITKQGATITALVTALDRTRHILRQAECYHDSELAKMYGQELRRVEKAIKTAGK